MKYKVYFSTGESIYITEDRFRNFLTNEAVEEKRFTEGNWQYLNHAFITHIVAENEVAQPGGVVVPPTPDAVALQKRKEQEEKLSNPTAIIEGIKAREEDDLPS